MRIYLIEFADSKFIGEGWRCLAHIKEEKALKCFAIGCIVNRTSEAITVAPYGGQGDFAQGLVIPRQSVKRIRQLQIRKGGIQ